LAIANRLSPVGVSAVTRRTNARGDAPMTGLIDSALDELDFHIRELRREVPGLNDSGAKWT
jgi:hypothetical protein